MNTKKLLLINLMLGFMISSYTQVKIGNNPNTIDVNSLLELETTNKGFLAPRVALNSITSVAPLTGTVTEGMLVYSTGGTLTNGFYVWSGTKWNRINTASRDNFVLVKSAADFPAPVAGVITLASNTVYELNGTITTVNKINLNNAWICGRDAINDKLIYTGATGELFTGSAGGNVRQLTLCAPTPGTKVFNINAAGANVNFTVLNCYIGNSYEVGVVQNFGGVVYFQTVAYLGNTNGITFQNDSVVAVINTLWDKNNHNTYEKFAGTFSAIQKSTGAMRTVSSNASVGIDVSGITAVSTAELKNVLFVGDGTFKTGSFSNNWEVEADGLFTEKDDRASGNIYISSTALTTFAAAGTPTKLLGSTSTADLYRVTSSTDNRMTYTGKKPRNFQAICSLTGTQTGSGMIYAFFIAKNGVVLNESKQVVKFMNSSDQQSVALSCNVYLTPGDYVEVWVANVGSTTGLTVQSLNLSIQ
jgi:hypothetical protein